MGRKNTHNRMTLSFDEERIRKLVKGLAADEAYLQNTSDSRIIIDRFLHSYSFPENKDACYFIENLYIGSGIKQTLEDFFSFNAAGIGWQPRYANSKTLIQFAHDIALRWHVTIDCQSSTISNVITNLEEIAQLIEAQAASASGIKKQKLLSEVKAGKNLCDLIQTETTLSYAMIASYLLNNWEIANTTTSTFRLLVSISRISSNWQDCDVQTKDSINAINEDAVLARKKLTSIFCAMSVGWDSAENSSD